MAKQIRKKVEVRSPRRARRSLPSKVAPRRRKAAPSASRGADDQVYLVVPGRKDPIYLDLGDDPAEVERLALKWSYSLRNRERWVGRPDLLERHRAEIKEVAALVGLHGAVLGEIAEADLIEISIPFNGEEKDWALRIMPWEYLIATATRGLRRGAVTVVRHLRAHRRTGALHAPRGWLHVESAVGELREGFDFSSERNLVDQAVATARVKLKERLVDPDLAALQAALKAVKDDEVVHISGFDSHQGLQSLDQPGAERVLDGLLVRADETAPAPGDDPRKPQVAESWAVARDLTSNGRPRLVALNIYYSAARSAAACVAQGAEAAIGFQDAFDDTLAELFYATFYQAWKLASWNTVAAFRHAWQTVRNQNQPLHGTGIVLWSARSIRETLPGYWTTGAKFETKEMNRLWTQAVQKDRITLTPENICEHVELDVQTLPALNYSILHNDGALFDRFTIRKTGMGVGRVANIHVHVELHVGTDSYPFRLTLDLGERQMQTDLRSRIRISLASALSRALRESVRTTIFVAVTWGDTPIRRETFPITLLPIDEWMDTDENRIWLPSFVQPRDPAVARVIDRAQRYLMAIADDPTMGFSGYQAVDTDLPEKAPPAERCADVDAQVRAVWSALLYELPLSYINPPPVFSDYSQRLRTPSDVVDGGRGTCIDLALLLASCLEYVEIYPVIFLLSDHAFPGYWRDEAYFDSFVEALAETEAKPEGPKQRAGQRYGWYLERVHFSEIVAEIHAGRLVPLETVNLTERIGFEEAVENGTGNLTSRRGFQAMLDIISARWDENSRVTPLPLLPAGR